MYWSLNYYCTIVLLDYNNNENIKLYSKLLNDEENLSDHKPLEIIINFYVDDNNLKTLTNNVEPKLYIKLPNLENNEIKKKFNDLLFINFYSNGLPIEDINNKQDYFDKMYNHITKSISIALNSCTQTIIQIKQQMMLIWVEKNINNKNLLNSLKKKFKKILKNHKRLYEKGEFYKITKIIKEKNSENFFRKE